MAARWRRLVLQCGLLSALALPVFAQDYEFYAVKAEDTLDSLASRRHVKTEEIVQLNPTMKSGLLPPAGTVIFIPVPPPPPSYAPRRKPRPQEGGAVVASRQEPTQVVRGGGPELSEEEVDAIYEDTVKPLAGQVAEMAQIAAAPLPDHQNILITSDGHAVAVPQARPRPRPKKQEEQASHARRSLSSRRGLQAQALLRSALKYMGVPYVWGGESPSGFDCSGFVQHVYAGCGIALPRTADLQYNVGRPVPAGKEQPGDLIYFETYCPGPSHIGIFLGRHQFVHASSGAGHITISDLREAHFQRCYLGAKRVF